jgi:hypothetical protein
MSQAQRPAEQLVVPNGTRILIARRKPTRLAERKFYPEQSLLLDVLVALVHVEAFDLEHRVVEDSARHGL